LCKLYKFAKNDFNVAVQVRRKCKNKTIMALRTLLNTQYGSSSPVLWPLFYSYIIIVDSAWCCV